MSRSETYNFFATNEKLCTLTTTQANFFPPVMENAQSASFMFRSPNKFLIKSNSLYNLNLNCQINLPEGILMNYFTNPTCGKQGLLCIGGIIDNTFVSKFSVTIHNVSEKSFYVDQGDVVANAIFIRYNTPHILIKTIYSSD
jgi:dUTPase